MEEVDRTVEAAETEQAITGILKDEEGMKLVSEMLGAKIVDIKPQFDFTTEPGFIYPVVEQTLNVKGKKAIAILESLADKGILKKSFYDRLLRCQRCHSINLRPSTHCPKCNSGNIARGRILEHSVCGYVGVEDEFTSAGKYVCPRCKMELRTMGADYQSRGVLHKCRDCGEVFNVSVIKWRCLKCSSLADEDKIDEVNIYAYSLDETKRSWLEFELQPKPQFVDLLRRHGYEVTGNARVKGRSGAEHSIDILATRDDGLVSHSIAIGIEIAREKVGLDRVLDFDVKAYDSGFHNKVLIVLPELGEEAKKFAQLQRIEILESKELERVLARGVPRAAGKIEKEPFEFKSKAQLVQYLERQGYTVKKNAKVEGRSGAEHSIDILATRDEGIITHRIAIDVQVAKKPIGLDKVFKFDDKAYDAGILDKVVIGVPGLTREARQFAWHQGTAVFETGQLEPEPPEEGSPES
jgi:predicted Zn-ribbon and HTH transcriptional regulator